MIDGGHDGNPSCPRYARASFVPSSSRADAAASAGPRDADRFDLGAPATMAPEPQDEGQLEAAQDCVTLARQDLPVVGIGIDGGKWIGVDRSTCPTWLRSTMEPEASVAADAGLAAAATIRVRKQTRSSSSWIPLQDGRGMAPCSSGSHPTDFRLLAEREALEVTRDNILQLGQGRLVAGEVAHEQCASARRGSSSHRPAANSMRPWRSSKVTGSLCPKYLQSCAT